MSQKVKCLLTIFWRFIHQIRSTPSIGQKSQANPGLLKEVLKNHAVADSPRSLTGSLIRKTVCFGLAILAYRLLTISW